MLKNVGENWCLLEKIRTRKRRWVGHVLRGECLIREVVEGRIDGKITRGRPRKGMLEEFLANEAYDQMKRRAHDRERVGRVGCHGPALWQSTDYDEQLSFYIL